jgi:hypothetical protein
MVWLKNNVAKFNQRQNILVILQVSTEEINIMTKSCNLFRMLEYTQHIKHRSLEKEREGKRKEIEREKGMKTREEGKRK